MPQYMTKGLVPLYVNNVRIEVTPDNVFLDFGFADPFATKSAEKDFSAEVQSRVVMNRSTFQNFVKHVSGVAAKMSDPSAPHISDVASRCPPGTSPEI